jgi:rare lipoprotein A
MKKYLLRKFLFLLLIVLAVPSLWAQIAYFQQRGRASVIAPSLGQGFFAFHPSLPMNTTVVISHVRSGRSAQVTITGRMASNPNSIVAISEDVSQALGLLEGDDVILMTIAREGPASWYGEDSRGRLTASGELYDPVYYTAAHPTLPFGTILIVTNRLNMYQAIVRVNDRVPYASARIIDVSRSAAEALDMIDAGTVPVTLEIWTPPPPPLVPASSNFREQGKAVVVTGDAMPYAGHPSLPIGQRINVMNARNGKIIGVVITGRYSAYDGIIALKLDILRALEWNFNDDVILTIP